MNSKKPSPLTILLVSSFLLFVVVVLVSSAVRPSHQLSTKSTSQSPMKLFRDHNWVGVLEIKGVITDSKKILAKLERLNENDSVKGIVIRLDSPGGAVGPSQEIYEAVKRIKKPVVASMGSVAASGAFYIACGAPKVYANPGTLTGSIGVIMEFANLEKLYDWAKIKRFAIKTGKFKDAGAEYREMTAEDRALLQGVVDDVLGQFKSAVSAGRKLSAEKVATVADGRIFSGFQAKQLGLVDELGTLDDAVAEVAKQAKISGKPKVVYPEIRKANFLFELLRDNDIDDDAESRSIGDLLGIKSLVSEAKKSVPVLNPGLYWLWQG